MSDMNEKSISNKLPPYLLTDQALDRREDVYSLTEFGKIVNRLFLSDQIYSDDFWKYINNKFKLKPENITFFCDVHSDTKNRVEKSYKYIIKVDKPFKLIIQFYDEEKINDIQLYDTEESQKNKISDLLIYFDSDAIEYVDTISNELRDIVFVQPINKTFFIIASNSMGYELHPASIKDYDIDIDLNYGDSFVDKHVEILKKIKKNKHGLFLFHGLEGCGKTMYLRKLVSELANEKTIIYVPSFLMMDIASPGLISFISKFKNAILLLEDAESILTSPQEERNQAVSNILNISDGLLNDHMDMQIIATFNVDKKIIDKALLRKGRLMVDCKFKKLTSKQATKLSEHIGLNKKYNEPATLADIYEEVDGGKQLIDSDNDTNKIGF